VNVFAAAVVALVVSFIGTRLALALANKHQLIIVPNARSSHAVPTPSAGGIGICLAVIVGLPVALLGGTAAALGWVAASTALAGWVGWRDDVRPLSPLLKMALLTVAAGALLLLGQLDGVTLPLAGRLNFGTLAVPLTLFWLVGFTNAFNFMDGIDGIAGLTVLVSGAAFATAAVGVDDGVLMALGVVTAAAATGFLPWNFPRARIFMGDTGSLPLGLLLAFCAVRASDSGALSFPASVLLLGPFVFDASFTLLRRLGRRERVWEAHKEHLYQRLARRLGGHPSAALIYAALAGTTSLLALTYDGLSEFGQALCLLLALGCMLAFATVISRSEGAGETTQPGESTETEPRSDL